MDDHNGCPISTFDLGDYYGVAYVERTCPQCHRFLSQAADGISFGLKNDTVTDVKGFICKTHGPVDAGFLGFF